MLGKRRVAGEAFCFSEEEEEEDGRETDRDGGALVGMPEDPTEEEEEVKETHEEEDVIETEEEEEDVIETDEEEEDEEEREKKEDVSSSPGDAAAF